MTPVDLTFSTQSQALKLSKITLDFQGQETDLIFMVASFSIIHNMSNIFPIATLTIGTEYDSFIETIKNMEDCTINIEFASGVGDKFFNGRKYKFKINNIASITKGNGGIRSYILPLALFDERYHTLITKERYNIFYDQKTKTQMLSDLLKQGGLSASNLDFTGATDTIPYDYYVLNETLIYEINRVRLLGDEPYFIYANGDVINIKNIDAIYNGKVKYKYVTVNTPTAGVEQLSINLLDVQINNFMSSFSDITGYKLFSYDYDAKSGSITEKRIPQINNKLNPDVYPIIRNRETFQQSLYKDCFYLSEAVSATINLANTDLKIGELVYLEFPKVSASGKKNSLSDFYFIYYIKESMEASTKSLKQELLFVRK